MYNQNQSKECGSGLMPGNRKTVVETAGSYFELCRVVDTKRCEHAQLNNVKISVKIQYRFLQALHPKF